MGTNFINILSEAIEKPAVKPWSLVPLLCLGFGLITVIIAVFLAKLLNKKENNKKIINIIFLSYGLIFLALEVYHEIKRFLDLGYYDFSSFPFQFCSIPIYFCLALPFIKNDKIREPFLYYFGIYCFISGLFPLLLGQTQLCRWSTIAEVIRSFIWHIMILQISIFSSVHVRIGYNIKETYKNLIGAVSIFVILTVIAQLINVTLHYAGGVNYSTSNGSPIKDVTNTYLYDPDVASCFYISPFFVSNMPVYGDIYRKFGWVANYIAYLFSFSLLAVIVYFLNNLILTLKDKIILKIQKTS